MGAPYIYDISRLRVKKTYFISSNTGLRSPKLGLFLSLHGSQPEDGSSRLLRKLCNFLPHYTSTLLQATVNVIQTDVKTSNLASHFLYRGYSTQSPLYTEERASRFLRNNGNFSTRLHGSISNETVTFKHDLRIGDFTDVKTILSG